MVFRKEGEQFWGKPVKEGKPILYNEPRGKNKRNAPTNGFIRMKGSHCNHEMGFLPRKKKTVRQKKGGNTKGSTERTMDGTLPCYSKREKEWESRTKEGRTV